jgi:hypothetical protein
MSMGATEWGKREDAIDRLVAEGKLFRVAGDPVRRDAFTFAVALEGKIDKLPTLGVLNYLLPFATEEDRFMAAVGAVAQRLWMESRDRKEPKLLGEASEATQDEFRSAARDMVLEVQRILTGGSV